MKKLGEAGYNERLFDKGFRRRFHLARFEWVHRSLVEVSAKCRTVMELGCFDGRCIDYLPASPESYLGLDANWEGGLDLAKSRYSGKERFQFSVCSSPNELRQHTQGRCFDTSLCLETLEHVPPDSMVDYVRAISEVTNGHLVVTVPNEKGVVFLSKYLVKKTFGLAHPYTPGEVAAATLGRMHSVARAEHKGFDYETVIEAVGQFFDIVEVSGYPFRSLPRSLGFGCGILAKSRGRLPGPGS